MELIKEHMKHPELVKSTKVSRNKISCSKILNSACELQKGKQKLIILSFAHTS
uniref:Uncharacterized protein n=1 Tax=Arundo donax TaxID=35708 RepID=A0A0A9EJI8_ARUDO